MRSSNRSPLTDELIIEKLKSNDLSERDEGWIAFDANYRLSIQNLVKSRLQEINAPQRAYLDAEDYTSAVILEVADSIGNYKEGNFHGWVTGITKNVVNTYARKVKNGQKAAAQMQLLIFQQKKLQSLH